MTTCLVQQWEIMTATGSMVVTDGPACGQAITTHEVKGGDIMRETHTPSKALEAGKYDMRVTFHTSPPQKAKAPSFEVK
jgi:hypothetical protein